MSIGLPVDKSTLDVQSGDVARRLNVALQDVFDLAYYLDGQTEADLVALGYTSQEVATLKTAYADLARLGQIYRGELALPEAYDHRTFARRLYAWS